MPETNQPTASQPAFHWSEEQKAALRAVWSPTKREEMASKQRAYWAAHKAPMAGKQHSEEAKRKMRASQLANWEKIRKLQAGS